MYVEPPATPGGCATWGGARQKGYGRVRLGRRVWLAHRMVWALHTGEHEALAAGDVVHHTCARGTSGCVDVRHLQATSSAANTAEMLGRREYLRRIAELEARVADLEAQLAAR